MKIKKLVKVTSLAATILAFGFLFTGCGKETTSSANETNQTEDKAEKVIKIATPGQNNALVENALLAEQLGYVKEELSAAGCRAEYVGFAQAGPAINEALAAGEVDFAVYNELPALVAKSNGVDIKIIATATQSYNYAVIAGKDSGIKSAADLEGKKVIVTAGTILYKYFMDLCEEYDIDPDSVEQINALADANSVLASGNADAYVTAYSAALSLQDQGLGTIVADTTAEDAASERTGIALVARSEALKENPDAATALIKAYDRASKYAQENPDKVYDLLETENSPAAILKQVYAYDTSFAYFSPFFTDQYKELVKNQYDFAKNNHLLGGDINFDELFDSAYADKAAE